MQNLTYNFIQIDNGRVVSVTCKYDNDHFKGILDFIDTFNTIHFMVEPRHYLC